MNQRGRAGPGALDTKGEEDRKGAAAGRKRGGVGVGDARRRPKRGKESSEARVPHNLNMKSPDYTYSVGFSSLKEPLYFFTNLPTS